MEKPRGQRCPPPVSEHGLVPDLASKPDTPRSAVPSPRSAPGYPSTSPSPSREPTSDVSPRSPSPLPPSTSASSGPRFAARTAPPISIVSPAFPSPFSPDTPDWPGGCTRNAPSPTFPAPPASWSPLEPPPQPLRPVPSRVLPPSARRSEPQAVAVTVAVAGSPPVNPAPAGHTPPPSSDRQGRYPFLDRGQASRRPPCPLCGSGRICRRDLGCSGHTNTRRRRSCCGLERCFGFGRPWLIEWWGWK